MNHKVKVALQCLLKFATARDAVLLNLCLDASADSPLLPTLVGGVHFMILAASDFGTNFIHMVVKRYVSGAAPKSR